MHGSNRLKGYVALVTGAASGLGKAVAEHFVNENACVVLVDLNSSDGQKVTDSLNKIENKITSPKAIFCSADITSENDVMDALEMCEKTFGKLNILVNCAGIFHAEKTMDDATSKIHCLDSFKKVIKVNLVGTFNVCRLACPLMAKNELEGFEERGVIINTSSILATEGTSTQVAYSTSKAAISGMTTSMARDLADIGIRVVGICPGPFMTTIIQKFLSTHPDYQFPFVFPARIGRPEEFADLVALIVKNKMLNGENIRLDGGLRF